MRKTPPCMECESRSSECHANCEKYAAWNAENVKLRKLRAAENDRWNNPKRPKEYLRMRLGIKK